MEQTMMWLMLCAGSAVVGVLIGLRLAKRNQRGEWHRGYAAGVEVLATVVKNGVRRSRAEGIEEVYLLPLAGLERVVKQTKELETVESAQKKQEK